MGAPERAMAGGRGARDEVLIVGTTRTLHAALSVGRVETVRCGGDIAEGFSPEFQVALPSHGMFIWQVGRDEVVADPTQVLFVAGGEPYRITRAASGGYQELII